MRNNFWSRLSGPVKVGLAFGLVAILLSVIGVARNPDVPFSVQSVLIATTISGLVWGIIAWAIATAAMDVEEEIEEREGAPLE